MAREDKKYIDNSSTYKNVSENSILMAKPEQFDCGLGPALKVIAGKWRPTIIWTLHAGPVRFGVLRRRIGGISEKVLSEELRALEESGIVHRESFEGRTPHVEYSLTPAGAELNGAVHALAEWGSRHFATVAQAACLQESRTQEDSEPDLIRT